jgi:mRNA-degrading endonuclease RelE of RelBE toxin-antitoxin system
VKQEFLSAFFTEEWKRSYADLSADLRQACDDRLVTLIKRENSPGLQVKPIQPEKHYLEARITSGYRVIFRIEAGTIYFVDVVKHDDIGRYGRRPRGPR